MKNILRKPDNLSTWEKEVKKKKWISNWQTGGAAYGGAASKRMSSSAKTKACQRQRVQKKGHETGRER